jgi:hypothetical protein
MPLCYNFFMTSDDAEFIPTQLTAAELDARLDKASDRRAAESARIREETRVLQTLLERKRRLAARMQATLAELQAEQETINAEVRRLLTPEEQTLFQRNASV